MVDEAEIDYMDNLDTIDHLGEAELAVLVAFEVFDRLGWRGVAPITLEKAGQKAGLTRERIRQLEKKLPLREP